MMGVSLNADIGRHASDEIHTFYGIVRWSRGCISICIYYAIHGAPDKLFT